ncbi:MAG: NADH-quinone oxidoreductase subunit H [Candidatus Didemnitutus sp.]|nr:NADH-quinone oxidoreductase subunit H [Candidatus Didemnitutus sp.]
MSSGAVLGAAVVGLMAGLMVGNWLPRTWLALTLGGCALALAAAVGVLGGFAPAWTWRSEFLVAGDVLCLRFDAVSALFLALVAVVGGAGAAYAHGYWPQCAHPLSARRGRVWWSLLLVSLVAVLVSAHGLQFLIGWELFTLAAFFLVTLDRRRAEVRAAGWLYLGASHAAVLALFAFFALLAARTGSWELGPRLAAGRPPAELAPLFWLALFGFGLKAGLFPLHIWLPSAHANAPSHVSAVLSGVTIKLGIYGLVRFSGWLPVPASAGWVVAVLGVASAVLGVAFALGQHDLKRLLAYHSVENIGIILIGLGFALVAAQQGNTAWGRLALAGGLLHVWNHGLFKSLLFFGAGSVLHATGTREMSRLGGLWRAMPWTAGLFALGAAAISGLPPLNGFVSEWLVYLGLFDAVGTRDNTALASIPAVVLLAMTGALALACFIKVCGVVFLGAPRSAAAERAHECGPWMRGPMLLLAAACVAIGVAPVLFWPAVARAAGEWNPAWNDLAPPPSLALVGACHAGLVVAALAVVWMLRRQVGRNGARRAVTWDCGYAAPTARMQYTAGSFAGIVVEWFEWILRPVRHGARPEVVLPRAAECSEHTPETVLEHVVEPAGGVVMRVSASARRLQHGRLQAYLLYLLIGVAALAALVVSGGGQ